MKKVLSLLLAILITLCTLTMISCKKPKDSQSTGSEIPENVPENVPGNETEKLNGKTPYQLFSDTVEKIKNMTNYTIESEEKIVVKYTGYTQTTTQTTVCRSYSNDNWYSISNKQTEDIYHDFTSETYEIWYVDKTMYCNHNTGEGIEEKKMLDDTSLSAIDEIGREYGFSSNDIPIFLLPESYFQNIHFEKDDENNTYKLTFSIDGEKFSELFFMDIALVGDITYVVHFDANGELQLIEISGELLPVLGSTGTLYTISRISDVGAIEKISAPEDADSYLPASMSGGL